MTQSYNLSQLANNLNSSGQLLVASGLSGATPLINGGTGATTAAGARTNLDVAQAVFAVPSGGNIMWSGSIATIATGWFLCNGSNSTPDLRNKFIVGASVDNAGVANTTITGANTQSGGSKDAITVSHSHTLSASGSTAIGGKHAHGFGSNNGTNQGYFGLGTWTGYGYPGSDTVFWNGSGTSGGSGGNQTSGNMMTTGAITNTIGDGHTHTLSGSTDAQGTTGTNANLVPYYALAYIMKS